MARPKEGPRAPLFYLLALFPGWPGIAAAQTVDLADLEVCAGLETPELKLACYEAIVATGGRAATDTAEPENEIAPDPVVASAEPGATAVTTTEAVAGTEPEAIAGAEPEAVADTEPEAVADTEPDPAPATAERAPVAAQAAGSHQETVAAAPQEPAATVAVADSFGSEHLNRESPDDPAVLNARVVEVSETGRGALVFHLDNGQVWRQIEPRYYPYPRDREFEVIISTGTLGTYRLQVEGTGRRVTIRRVK